MAVRGADGLATDVANVIEGAPVDTPGGWVVIET